MDCLGLSSFLGTFWGQEGSRVIEAVIGFLIFLIVLCLFVALVLWAVKAFFPAIFEPAKYVVGALALIAILVRLAPLLGAVFP